MLCWVFKHVLSCWVWGFIWWQSKIVQDLNPNGSCEKLDIHCRVTWSPKKKLSICWLFHPVFTSFKRSFSPRPKWLAELYQSIYQINRPLSYFSHSINQSTIDCKLSNQSANQPICQSDRSTSQSNRSICQSNRSTSQSVAYFRKTLFRVSWMCHG